MVVVPPQWTIEEFEADTARSINVFRQMRISEPLEEYLDVFDEFRDAVDDVLESTVDLSLLSDQAVELLCDPRALVAIRYLASPAISEDDLKVVAEVASLTPTRLRQDPETAKRVISTVLLALDRHRFPWVGENRDATAAQRANAVTSTTALIAAQRVQTKRRTAAKDDQERQVCDYLVECGFLEVPTRTISNASSAYPQGSFSREALLGSRKADVIVRLWDGRILPIECKVSNSSTNSVKRLNNDAAVKAKTWLEEFGRVNVVPSAVVSGVFKVHNLLSAQTAGLTIFWSHNLEAMGEFIEKTKP